MNKWFNYFVYWTQKPLVIEIYRIHSTANNRTRAIIFSKQACWPPRKLNKFEGMHVIVTQIITQRKTFPPYLLRCDELILWKTCKNCKALTPEGMFLLTLRCSCTVAVGDQVLQFFYGVVTENKKNQSIFKSEWHWSLNIK